MSRFFALFVSMATVSVAVAQQQYQPKPSLTISYFKKNDSNAGEVLSALTEEPKCTTIDANVYDHTATDSLHNTGGVDAMHETWWLIPSPRTYSGYKKYRFNYVLEPPGARTEKDMVVVVSDKTSRGLAARICSEVTGMPGARIHMK